ncbi:MAG TPA: SMC-Scp complex subunit ScpB [Bacillota bacterium]|nr:SMC-Scp complex subunit ScpB [Bacillota bacterium]HOK68488.1 SMC-Scp complex subunit ScpB [Bacillota bacterium]HPP85116.1 SMC-Scp complex subunit ScpB [Bacillota bacterium]
MINKEIIAAAEAILFACGSPVEQDKLKEILNITAEELNEVCAALRERYDREDSGISLIAIENAYQLCTKPAFADPVRKALQMRKVPPLSKASLEVLAIVAYNQPVTRSFIEMVRGVDSSYIVNSLVDKGLIAECGTLDAPGRPTLYATTDNFLRCFGLESLNDLPEALPEPTPESGADTASEPEDPQVALNIDELESREAADSL